jgi:hypothetical protein
MSCTHLGGLGDGDWCVALRGEGLGELGGSLPAEAECGRSVFFVGAPGGQRDAGLVQRRTVSHSAVRRAGGH